MKSPFFEGIKPTVVGINKAVRRQGTFRHRNPNEIGVASQKGIDNPVDASRAKKLSVSADINREAIEALRDFRAEGLAFMLTA